MLSRQLALYLVILNIEGLLLRCPGRCIPQVERVVRSTQLLYLLDVPSSFFSAIFGTKLLGSGCVYVWQSLKFLRPVCINDTVNASVCIKAVDKEKRRIAFDTTNCVKGNFYKQKLLLGSYVLPSM
jgi:hypothetical protein